MPVQDVYVTNQISSIYISGTASVADYTAQSYLSWISQYTNQTFNELIQQHQTIKIANAWLSEIWAQLRTQKDGEEISLADLVKDCIDKQLEEINKSITRVGDMLDSTEPWISQLTDEDRTWLAEFYGYEPESMIASRFTDYIKNIYTFFANFWVNFKKWIEKMWAFIWGDIITKIPEFTKGLFADIITWISETYAEIVKAWEYFKGGALHIWDWIKKVARNIWEGIKETITELLPGIAEQVYYWISGGLSGFWNWIKNFYEMTIEGIRNTVLGTLHALFAITPDQAPSTATALFGLAMAGGLLVHNISIMGEHSHPTKEVGWNYLAGFLAEFTGYKAITSQSYGVLLRTGLGIPYRYWANDQFRTKLPDELTLQIMAVKPDIDMGTFDRYMAYQGYPNYWIDRIKKTMFREPGYFELSAMLEDNTADATWLFEKARRRGYIVRDGQILTRALVNKSIRNVRTDYYRACVDLFTDGFINDQQFDTYLADLELRPEANIFSKKVAKLKFMRSYIDNSIRGFIALYREDIMTEDDLLNAFTGLGVIPEVAQMKVSREATYKKGKIAKEEKKEIEKNIRDIQRKYSDLYLRQFRDGVISKERLRINLSKMGYEDDFIDSVIELESYKIREISARQELRTTDTLIKKESKLWEKAYITMYRKDLVTDNQLTEYLLAIGIDPDIVQATVESERIAKYKPPKPDEVVDPERISEEAQKKWQAVYIEEFRREMIDDKALYNNLVDLGIPPAIATPIVQREVARKYKPAEIIE